MAGGPSPRPNHYSDEESRINVDSKQKMTASSLTVSNHSILQLLAYSLEFHQRNFQPH